MTMLIWAIKLESSTLQKKSSASNVRLELCKSLELIHQLLSKHDDSNSESRSIINKTGPSKGSYLKFMGSMGEDRVRHLMLFLPLVKKLKIWHNFSSWSKMKKAWQDCDNTHHVVRIWPKRGPIGASVSTPTDDIIAPVNVLEHDV